VTTLKRQATELLAEIARDREPMLITQHGIPSAYLVDAETYENLQNRLMLLPGNPGLQVHGSRIGEAV
jgi:prevent-host-death family protein